MKICLILGTRPELIKFTPLIKVLQSRSSIDLCVINTSQHTDLLNVVDHSGVFTECTGWHTPVTGYNTLSENLGYAISALTAPLTKHRPDLVLVQGDTTSALAGALTAFCLKIPVGHVEAGLRTHDRNSPFPEETNRKIISHVAEHHFCISTVGRQNLLEEGITRNVHVVGSTAIDALKQVHVPITERLRKYILLTLHRRENLDSVWADIYLQSLVKFLLDFPDVTCLWVTHPNPKAQALIPKYKIDSMGCVEAVDHKRFIQYASYAWAICSDSGGIQEENTVLQQPLFILRDKTERPEVLTQPNVRLVHYVPLYDSLLSLLVSPEKFVVARPCKVFGDGNAAIKIGDILATL